MTRVHIGEVTNELGETRPCAWVETTLTLDPEGRDLLNALGSRYFRDHGLGDDEAPSARPERLPAALSRARTLKIYREELRRYGENALWTWADEMSEGRQRHVEGWLTELVVGAFPEMKGYL